jgi:hypothetical protein
MNNSFYSCNHCNRVLTHDRYHLINSEDYDICYYDYSQLDDVDRTRFCYVLNEHMGGPVGYADELEFSDEEEEEAQVPATEEEDFAEALFGCASQDDMSQDSTSFGSLEDFFEENDTVIRDEVLEPIGPIESMDMDTFMSSISLPTQFPPIEQSFTRMEDEYGQEESDWSETDDEEGEEEADVATRESARDRAEEQETKDNHEVIRVPNRAFGKRQIKPRIGNLFTYPINWIKNGGEAEY